MRKKIMREMSKKKHERTLALVMGIFSSDLRMRKSKQETTQLKIKH